MEAARGQRVRTARSGQLLAGALGESARAAAHAIGRRIAEDPLLRAGGVSLSDGGVGIATVLAHLGRAFGERAWLELARDEHRLVLDALASTPLRAGLHAGLTGVGWLTAHLAREGLVAEDFDFEEIDAAVSTWLRAPRLREYDLISGSVGLGVYALEREHDGLLAAVVGQLIDRSVRFEGETSWKTPPELLPPHQREVAPDGYYNLGLAHGIPGIVVLLAECECRIGLTASQREHLRSATRGLLAQRREGSQGLHYPSWRTEPEITFQSRLGWCYGDLSVAVALLACGRALQVEEWIAEGCAIALEAAGLVPGDVGIRDPGICHGASGVAHLLHRMSQQAESPELAAAAQRWFTCTLSMRRAEEGVAGFDTWRDVRAADMQWKTERRAEGGYLLGAGGVALALATAACEGVGAWDAPLLLSFERGEA